MPEKLMNSEELTQYLTNLEKKFEVGILNDYKNVKLNGEKFLKEAYSIRPRGLLGELKDFVHMANKKEDTDFYFKTVKYRILLGIGVELIVKAAFIKQGYVINAYNAQVKEIRLIKRGKPEKISSVNKSELSTGKTHNISFLVRNIDMLFPENMLSEEEFNTWIRKGLEIARIWRNKEIHLNSGYHEEKYGEDEAIKTSLANIYKYVFDDEDQLRKILGIPLKNVATTN